MGKISNITNKFNEKRAKKLEKSETHKLKKINDEIIEAKIKPRLRLRSFKDVATLLGPNGSKYKLSKNQRNFQLKGRLTIAAIATALAIGGTTAVAHNISSNSSKNPETEQSTEYLEANSILKEANTRIRQYVYGNDTKKIENSFISYDYDASNNSNSFKVGRNRHNYDEEIDFLYSNASVLGNIKNSSDINKLIEQMIEIHYSETPTNKQLKDLQSILDKLENRKFKLNGKSIVEEKDLDYER